MHVVAVAGTFSCDPYERWLRAWLSAVGLSVDVEVRMAAYGQLIQELTAPSAFQGANVCIGLLNFADWWRDPTAQRAFDVRAFESDVDLFVKSLRTAISSHHLPRVLIVVCPALPSEETTQHYAAAMSRLKALRAELPRLVVATPADVTALYPVAEPHDRVGDALGHIPYTEALFCALGAASARAVLPALAPSSAALVKCIAVDCDFTLWHGAVGEVGVSGLSCEPRHFELQERLLLLRRRGVALALCSKNAPDDVWAALASGKTALTREHITIARIEPTLRKSDALRSISQELHLSTENIMLIDDNPAECAEVRAALPSVAVWCWPASNHAQAKNELNHVWQLDLTFRPPPTEEDERRVGTYAAAAQRIMDVEKAMQMGSISQSRAINDASAVGAASASAMRDLYASMNVTITFETLSAASEASKERVLQLLERSNQFNAWKRPVVPECVLSSYCEGVAMTVTDRYGAYGLVGVALGLRDGDVLRVLAFAMSCRVLGRGAEHAMLSRVGELALLTPHPCSKVAVATVRTSRNLLASKFLNGVDGAFARAASTASERSEGSRSEAQAAAHDLPPHVTDWLREQPHEWHAYDARWLADEFRFDPAAMAEASQHTEEASPSTETSQVSEGSSVDGSALQAGNSRIADALSRAPQELRTIEQFMHKHGCVPSIVEGMGPSGAWTATTVRDALHSVWTSVLGGVDNDVASLQDDVPFGAYGGNSVLAVQTISLADRHGLRVPHGLANSLDQMTIAQLVPLCLEATQGHGAGGVGKGAGAAAKQATPAPAVATMRIIERDGRKPSMPLKPVGGLSACAAGDLDAARALAESGTWHPAHAVDKHGTSALMWAAGGGHVEVVKWLLEAQGVAVDKSNKDGRTALMWACKNGHFAVVRYLLEIGGADVTLRMKDDSTAFDWAVLGGDEPTMEMLAAHPDVDIHALNKFGCASVQWAAAAGNVSSCKWLYAKGVDFGHVNTANHGAIVKAAWKGHDACLRWLLFEPDGPRLTWQLTLRDHDGRTVAELARMNSKHETADWLQGLIEAEEQKAG